MISCRVTSGGLHKQLHVGLSITRNISYEGKVRLTSRWVYWMSVVEIRQCGMKKFDLPLGHHMQLYGLNFDVARQDFTDLTLNSLAEISQADCAKTGE